MSGFGENVLDTIILEHPIYYIPHQKKPKKFQSSNLFRTFPLRKKAPKKPPTKRAAFLIASINAFDPRPR
jgi:hypothetical protein